MEGLVIVLMMLSAYLMLALVTFDPLDPGWSRVAGTQAISNAGGRVGAFCADLLFHLFGYLAFLFPLLVGFWAFRVLRERHAGLPGSWPMFTVRLVGFTLTMIAGTALCHIHLGGNGSNLPEDAGGILGAEVGMASLAALNPRMVKSSASTFQVAEVKASRCPALEARACTLAMSCSAKARIVAVSFGSSAAKASRS